MKAAIRMALAIFFSHLSTPEKPRGGDNPYGVVVNFIRDYIF
jgi:hypothetical protein